MKVKRVQIAHVDTKETLKITPFDFRWEVGPAKRTAFFFFF